MRQKILKPGTRNPGLGARWLLGDEGKSPSYNGR